MGSDAGSAACRMASILDIAATCASKNKMPAAHQTIFLIIAISPKLAPRIIVCSTCLFGGF